MKIKNQLRLFLIGIIAVPLASVVFFSIYHYNSNPEIFLIKGTKQIRKIFCSKVSDNESLKNVIKILPEQIEFFIINDDSKILLTNISELCTKESINDEEITKFIKTTSNKYFYQIVSPSIKVNEKSITLFCRVDRIKQKKEHLIWRNMYIAILILITLFEVFCILMIAQISTTISKSITHLEENTEKIARGELDVIFEKSKRKNEITRLTENLDKMRLSIKDSSDRRAKFIMGISHDLRTPVAVIKGYTEAINDGLYDTPEEFNNSIEIIMEKTEQLESMINTLINFVKLNQTTWFQQLKKQNLTTAIKEFAKDSVITGEVFKRKVEIEINLDEDIEVPFDKLLIQRAFENLFTNAIRYTKDGDSIKLSADYKDNKVILKIKDTGIGIDEKDMDQIFDLFYRGTNSRRESGMGIGLSVVKTIIDSHGWKISVESQKNIGTEFTIVIDV